MRRSGEITDVRNVSDERVFTIRFGEEYRRSCPDCPRTCGPPIDVPLWLSGSLAWADAMRENIIEAVVHLLLIIAYAIAAVLIAVMGAILEYQSYLHMLAGEYPLAGWIALIGAVLFVFSYLCITDKLLPALQ